MTSETDDPSPAPDARAADSFAIVDDGAEKGAAEEVTAAGGARYRVTVAPYRPTGNAVGGASLTFAAAPPRAEA